MECKKQKNMSKEIGIQNVFPAREERKTFGTTFRQVIHAHCSLPLLPFSFLGSYRSHFEPSHLVTVWQRQVKAPRRALSSQLSRMNAPNLPFYPRTQVGCNCPPLSRESRERGNNSFLGGVRRLRRAEGCIKLYSYFLFCVRRLRE